MDIKEIIGDVLKIELDLFTIKEELQYRRFKNLEDFNKQFEEKFFPLKFEEKIRFGDEKTDYELLADLDILNTIIAEFTVFYIFDTQKNMYITEVVIEQP